MSNLMYKIDLILKKLQRITTERQDYIPEIDGLRFLAIFFVFLSHLQLSINRHIPQSIDTSSWLYFFSYYGGVGVKIFFVISGFILALPFAKFYLNKEKSISLSRYYLRRLTRLEPPYLISLSLIFIFGIFFGWFSIADNIENYFSSFFYIHNVVYDKWSTINPVAWSLEIEIQFYLLAPFIALLFKIKKKLIRRMVFVGLILVNIYLIQNYWSFFKEFHLRKSILSDGFYFLIGFLLADFYVFPLKVKISKYVLDVVAVISLGLIFFTQSKIELYESKIAFCFLSFIIFISAFNGSIFSSLLKNRYISTMGGMCYSIYLLHYGLIYFLIKYTKSYFFSTQYELVFLIQFLICFPLVMLASILFFKFIERPFMDPKWVARVQNVFK